MELDELKQSWKQSAEKMQGSDSHIQSVIANKDRGPVAELKARFRKGMILIPLIMAIALMKLPKHHGLAFDLFFSLLSTVAILMTAYFYFNYKLVSSMQAMDGTVKDNLQKQVRILEKGVRFRLLFTRTMLLVFIVLLELLSYQGKEMEGWYSQALVVRLMVYAFVFAGFYLLTHLVVKNRYSKYISHLRELVDELE